MIIKIKTIEKISNFLFNAVANLANKGKNLGLMLSGGLDSSSIAIALKESNFNQVRTYSANFYHVHNNSDIHEAKYQKNVSDLTSYPHIFNSNGG